MPHITLEYSHNIQNIDFQSLFEDLKNRLVATGEVQELGVKCRAVASDHYYIVNGNPAYKMANLLFRMREGRSQEIKNLISKIGMEVMENHFSKEVLAKEIILSTEVKELIAGQDLTKNSIR